MMSSPLKGVAIVFCFSYLTSFWLSAQEDIAPIPEESVQEKSTRNEVNNEELKGTLSFPQKQTYFRIDDEYAITFSTVLGYGVMYSPVRTSYAVPNNPILQYKRESVDAAFHLFRLGANIGMITKDQLMFALQYELLLPFDPNPPKTAAPLLSFGEIPAILAISGEIDTLLGHRMILIFGKTFRSRISFSKWVYNFQILGNFGVSLFQLNATFLHESDAYNSISFVRKNDILNVGWHLGFGFASGAEYYINQRTALFFLVKPSIALASSFTNDQSGMGLISSIIENIKIDFFVDLSVGIRLDLPKKKSRDTKESRYKKSGDSQNDGSSSLSADSSSNV